MGTWGAGIFSDDDANDIRDNYRDYLCDDLSNEEATHQLMSEWGISGFEAVVDNTVFWLALASEQWQAGRLSNEVKQNAIEIIESGLDLKRWEHDPKLHKRRAAVLHKLKKKLDSPLPKKKRYKKKFRDYSEWKRGSVIRYRLLSGNSIFLRVLGHHTDKGGTSPVFELLDWVGKELPSKWRIHWFGIREGENEGVPVGQFMVGRLKEKELPLDRIEVMAKRSLAKQNLGNYFVSTWTDLDRFLKSMFSLE